MTWMVNDRFNIVIVVVCVVAIIIYIKRFLFLPTKERISKVREWLLYAVTMAEKEYGSGTGKLKLRYVYDLFLSKFNCIAMLITFEQFSELVDKALEEMRPMLEQNERVAELVSGTQEA